MIQFLNDNLKEVLVVVCCIAIFLVVFGIAITVDSNKPKLNGMTGDCGKKMWYEYQTTWDFNGNSHLKKEYIREITEKEYNVYCVE